MSKHMEHVKNGASVAVSACGSLWSGGIRRGKTHTEEILVLQYSEA